MDDTTLKTSVTVRRFYVLLATAPWPHRDLGGPDTSPDKSTP